MHRLLGLLIICCTLSYASCFAEESAAKQQDGKRKQIETLIAQLVSPNKAPEEDKRIKLSHDYDVNAQQRIVTAWQQLILEGRTAFPYLVANSGDSRYSCSRRGPSGDKNITVGLACQSIIRSQIQVYPNCQLGRWSPRLNFGDDIKVWWRSRKNMRLRELQIECAEDALQQLKAIRGGDLYQSYDAPEDAESQRHEHIEIVERFIVALKQADQPIINTDLPYQFIQKRP